MSVLNQSGEEQVECPLCMEPLEVDDLHFYPCTCGYQICRFCWNRIREGENGLCPACRKAYPENPADFTPLSQEQVAAIKTEKRAREQRRRNKTLESRRQLANVRVVQNNLVFVVGLPVRLAHPEILKRQEYFGKYGKIHKVVINQSTTYAGSQGPSASAYVTYVSGADALRAIQSVNNVSIDGRVLKGSLGTTKYCANFMKNQPCPKTDCMYLHELGDPKASFTKEQMHQGLHQIYERKLHNQLLAATAAAATAGEGGTAGANGGTGGGTTGSGGASIGGGKAGGGTGSGNGGSGDKSSTKDGFIPTTIITSSNAHTVTSNKSKKDLQTTSSSPSSTSSSSTSSSTSSSSGGGKEAWPSLGCSPPAGGRTDQQTQQSQGQGQSITNADSSQNIVKNNRDSNTTENSNKNPGKSKDSISSQPKPSNSISIKNGTRKGSCEETYRNGSSDMEREQEDEEELVGNGYSDNKHFDNYMGDNLDIDTDDRHSLLDNHDLLDSSEHSLLEDEVHGHNMNEGVLQRHVLERQGVDSGSLVDTFGLLDSNRDLRGYLADRIQNHSSLLESKELMMLRERQESEMLMRQNEMLARRNHLNLMSEQGKHYMGAGAGGLGLESTNELLGAPYPPTSPHLLPSMGLSRLEGPRYGAAKPPSHMVSNGDTRGAESGRYIGENSMDKFITDFHKNQQMKFLMQQQQNQVATQPIQQGQGPLHHQSLPTSTDGLPHSFHPEMHSHAIIESQHLQRKYGNIINNSSQSVGGNSGSNVSEESNIATGTVNSAGQTPRIVDDDLDFDPFKETQKALAEMMESEVLVQQNGSGSLRTDASERLRHSRPPPGFSHMNAFGIGVPRPQATPQGFSSSSAMISDWTQMDPAIMSTSVNFPQKNLLQQSLLTHQQQELYARFNQGLNINPQPPNGISKLLLNGQHPALAQQMQGMASQRLPQHNGMVLNPNQLLNGQSNQQYLAPHLQQNKLQSIMSNPPNGWALNNLSPNFSGLNLNANGIYGSHVQAALLANGTVENTKAYNSISLPPGFTNLGQNSKASPIPTECIESK